MAMLKSGDYIGLVACSNAQPISNRNKIEALIEKLEALGLNVICSKCIYEREEGFSGTALQKAEAFMEVYKHAEVKVIFDISGGDLANEVLPYLDYEVMKLEGKPIFGYSDLTTVLNGIYAKTGCSTYLYQIRHLIGIDGALQEARFKASLFEGQPDLYDFEYEFIQGEALEGVVVGGNIRCLLKLAGTPYMPDFRDKILFLESQGGGVPQMTTFLNQYKQMGVFDEVRGIVLGTFSNMEREGLKPAMEALVERIVAHPNLPIVKTYEIGHGADAKCLKIGEKISLMRHTK